MPICVAVGGDADGSGHTVMCTAEGSFSFVSCLEGQLGLLGHGAGADEDDPIE
jgi:hypothetical protein